MGRMKDRIKLKGTRKHFHSKVKEYHGFWEGGSNAVECKYIFNGPLTHFLSFKGNDWFKLEGMLTSGGKQYNTGWLTGSHEELKVLIKIYLRSYQDIEDAFVDEVMKMNEQLNNKQ